MKMNRIVLLMLTSLLSFSCKDDEKINVEVEPVSNITYEEKSGGVLFKWNSPETDLSYVEILFKKDVEHDELQRVIVAHPKNEQLIYGLPDANEREYTFIAHQGEYCSTPVSIAAVAGNPPYRKLLNSLNVSTNLEGVKVTWENEEEGEYYIEMFIDSLKSTPDYEIVVKEIGKGERRIPIDGVFSANLHFITSDIYANQSNSVVRMYRKMEDGWLDRKIWTILECSSEELQKDVVNGIPQTAAASVLDGNIATFWHTRWFENPTAIPYPHSMVFDLFRKVELSAAEVYRCQIRTNLQMIEIQGGVSSNGPWETIVTHEMLTHKAVQSIPFPHPVQYQYVRLNCTRGDNLNASLAEFSLFGKDLEEE